MADNMNVTTEHETPEDHLQIAKDIVGHWIMNQRPGLVVRDQEFYVYVVWFCFILGGWKALISTDMPDGRYYEVTYNKAKGVAYLDVYQKTHNIEVGIHNQAEPRSPIT